MLTMPVPTVSMLLELLFQDWAAPRVTGAEMVLAPEPALTVMPPPLICRVPPAPAPMLDPAVLELPVPTKVRPFMANA